jgi:hypothetical protein
MQLINDHSQNYKAYGFEIKKNFYKEAQEKVLKNVQTSLF